MTKDRLLTWSGMTTTVASPQVRSPWDRVTSSDYGVDDVRRERLTPSGVSHRTATVTRERRSVLTQIVGALRRGWIFQSSDRELTAREFAPSGSVRAEWTADRRSNKSLIVVTHDAIAAVGYCGTASMDNLPTDTWLAGAFTSVGRKLWERPTALNYLHRHDMGEVVRCLDTRVAEYKSRRKAAKLEHFDLEVQVVGYRVRRRTRDIRWLPFVFRRRWVGTDLAVAFHERPLAQSLLDLPAYFTPTPPRAEREAINEQWFAPEDSPFEAMEALGRVTRAVADQRSGVGREMLGLAIEASTKCVHLNFSIEKPDELIYEFGRVPVLWSPWIVGPGTALQPMVQTGGEMFLEGCRTTVVSANPPAPDPASARPPAPGLTPLFTMAWVPMDRAPRPRSGAATYRQPRRRAGGS